MTQLPGQSSSGRDKCARNQSCESSDVRVPRQDDAGWRLYLLLALFDRRDNTTMGDLVRSAREGYERSDPDMGEDDAWAEFDCLWNRFSSRERIALARAWR